MQEWFDKEYTAREVYGRLLKKTRKYTPLLVIGIVTGMLVGGTWWPLYQMLQPAIIGMQGSNERAQSDNTGLLRNDEWGKIMANWGYDNFKRRHFR